MFIIVQFSWIMSVNSKMFHNVVIRYIIPYFNGTNVIHAYRKKKYIQYSYGSHEYNSKSIYLIMKTLKEVYEEMSLTWLDHLFQQLFNI